MRSEAVEFGGMGTAKGQNALSKEIGRRVAEAMRRAGMKQEALAEATGISQPVVSKIVHGRLQRPNVDYVVRIAEALGVPAESLLPTGALPSADSRGAATRAAPRERPGRSTAPEEVSAGPAMLPPGLAEYLEKHEREIRPVIVDHLKRTRFHTEPWVTFDEKFWDRMVEFWEDEYRRSKKDRGGNG